MTQIKKILLVDDDIDLLDQTKLILLAKGYEVVTAETAEEGYNKFEEFLPDALLIDLMMEEHDSGFILSYKVRKPPHGKNVPIIMMTSAAYLTNYKFNASTEEEKEWLKCDAVLNKPVIIEDLLQKLESFNKQD